MCEQQNHVPVGVTSNTKQAVEEPLYEEKQSLKQYYLEQVGLLCPALPRDIPEKTRLWALLRKTRRIVALLAFFDRPWVSGSGDIQKACAHYLVHASLTKAQRDAFIQAQGEMACTVCHLAACSDFIAQMQRYFRCQEQELRQLLDSQGGLEGQKEEEEG